MSSFNTIEGGAGNDTLNGTGADDYLLGFQGSDTLSGGAGNDVLDGGGGGDVLIGGTGDNTYVIHPDDGDSITEAPNNGNDRALTFLNFGSSYNMLTSAPNVEDIRLVANYIWDDTLLGAFTGKFIGTSAATLTGNSLDNIMEGDFVSSALVGGNVNTLIGGAGNDTYVEHDLPGGALSDVIVEAAGPGGGTHDTVMYTPGVLGQTYDLNLLSNVEDLTLGGKLVVTGRGTAGDNIITGNTAIDTLIGGLGNDTYVINNVSTKIIENAGEGIDTVSSKFSYSIATQPNLENITLTGTSNVTATGNGGVNTLVGNDGSNILDGVLNTGANTGLADTFFGSLGNDTYIVHQSTDTILADTNTLHPLDGGIDLIMSSVSYDMSSYAQNVENLTLTGTANINATGNVLANTIVGNAGNNIIDSTNSSNGLIKGGAGNDTLYSSIVGGNQTIDGGTGADTIYTGVGHQVYIVDNAGDRIVQGVTVGGLHAIDSYVTFDMNVQAAGTGERELNLEGNLNINGYGNQWGDSLVGNVGNNVIVGGIGDDTIVGGGGTDHLSGGDGNDTITGGSGIDVLDGGNGNDSLISSGGRDTLIGGTGDDDLKGNGSFGSILNGGDGNDVYEVYIAVDTIVDSSGIDTVAAHVSYTLPGMIENLQLVSGSVGIGNALDNYITGNGGAKILEGLAGSDTIYGTGGNTTLDGGTGADTLFGAQGNDTFVVDNPGDVVTLAFAGGIDTIMSSVNWDMSTSTTGDFVRNLTLTGSVATLAIGNGLDNVITDNGVANETLAGGGGGDTYMVSNAGDVITEAVGGGIDTVVSGISFALPTNGSEVENLTLTGIGDLTGTGNDLNNVLTANKGADTLIGGLGNDTYVLGAVLGSNQLPITIIMPDTGGIDTVNIGASYSIASRLDLENITLSGSGDFRATGNTDVNVLTGNAGNNILDAQLNTGAFSGLGDTYIGSDGNDTYMINQSLDIVTAADPGTDLCIASVSYDMSSYAQNTENLTLIGSALVGTGNTHDNVLTGDNLNNTLIGGAGNDAFHAGGSAGIDTFVGGTGNDTFYVDNSGDFISENGGEGTDTVIASVNYDMSTLALNVEILTLTGTAVVGTGNASNNTITGTSGNNTLYGLAGNDTIDGGAGIDTMFGGTGNDTFIVDNIADVITELTGEGTADLIKTALTYVLPVSTVSEIENLTLTGTANVNGTGNDLVNTITGNTGNNILDGGLGADTMIGGGGTDTFLLDNSGDVVQSGAGTVIVNSSNTFNTYDMSVNAITVINAVIAGNNGTTLTGNAFNNIITTDNAVDTINGWGGADTIFVHNANDVVLDSGNVAKFIVDLVVIDTGNITGTSLDAFNAPFYDMSANAANIMGLTLTGSGNFDVIANNVGDTISGNGGINHFTGGSGDDTFFVGANDFVVTGGGGSDTVGVGFSLNLTSDEALGAGAHWNGVENILLTGALGLNATGDTHANTITGNSGNNILDDGGVNLFGGVDTMIGGAGNDTYYVNNTNDICDEVHNNAGGTDWVYSNADTYALGLGVDNLAFGIPGSGHVFGGGGVDGFGNALANTIIGTSGNDYLDGGIGADTLIGGLGNDTYGIDSSSDTIVDTGGIDTVIETLTTYTLPVGMENLTLAGTSAQYGIGNAVVNIIHASTATTIGDTLDGGAGADTMYGADGNDTFFVDNAHDVVYENSALSTSIHDAVISKISVALSAATATEFSGTYNPGNPEAATFNFTGFTSTNPDNGVENLTLSGTALIGIGNDNNNTIVGNSGANTLVAGHGTDFLDGGLGKDVYIGGTGPSDSDTFVIGTDAATNHDTIYNYTAADILDFNADLVGFDPAVNVLSDFVAMRWDGQNTLVYLDKDGVTGTQFGFTEVAIIVGVNAT